MNTNRLVQIIDRQRQGRIRDLAFAILIALVIVLQVTSLRAAACAASAVAASRRRSRLPQKGNVCITVYFVSPTREGSKLGDASLP